MQWKLIHVNVPCAPHDVSLRSTLLLSVSQGPRGSGLAECPSIISGECFHSTVPDAPSRFVPVVPLTDFRTALSSIYKQLPTQSGDKPPRLSDIVAPAAPPSVLPTLTAMRLPKNETFSPNLMARLGVEGREGESRSPTLLIREHDLSEWGFSICLLPGTVSGVVDCLPIQTAV